MVKAGDLLARAVKTLKGSTAIDHWQSDREEIESEELLAFAMDVEVDDLGPED